MVQTFLLFDTITNEKTVKFMQRDIITSITWHLGLVSSNNFGECTSFSPFTLGTIGPSYSLGRLDFFFLSCPLYLSPYSRLSSCLRLLFLCLISLLLFPYASFGKTLLHEFHISYCHTEWYLQSTYETR